MRNLISMDFLVVGAQKCATSWLYYCLRDHPAIHLPGHKRDDVYLGGDLHQKHGTDWYFNYVGEPTEEQEKGDVSVNYLFDPRSPEAIQNVVSDVKIVASLRDPIDRAISAYYWNMRKKNIPDVSVKVGIKQCLQSAMADRNVMDIHLSDEYKKNITLRGVYDAQIERYVDTFGVDSLFVMPKEKVEIDATQVLESLYRFLKVDAAYRPSQLHQEQRPKQNSYLPALLRFERKTPDWPLFNWLVDLANQAACRYGLGQGRPNLPDNLYSDLRDYYQDSVRRTFKIVQEIPSSAHLWTDVSWLDGRSLALEDRTQSSRGERDDIETDLSS
jgi:hypothetical protein